MDWLRSLFRSGKWSGRINVRDYGASPDRTGAENIEAFQRAIQEAELRGGAEVFVPAGDYRLARTPSVHFLRITRSGVRLIGEGYATQIIGPETGPVIEVHDNDSNPCACEHVGIANLRVERANADGRRLDDVDVGIQVLCARHVTIENVWLYWHGKAIIVGFPGSKKGIPAQHVHISGCTIGLARLVGILFLKGADHIVSKCKIEASKYEPDKYTGDQAAGIRIESNANAITICDGTNIVTGGHMDYGIVCDALTHENRCFAITITGCMIENARSQNIYLAHHASEVTVAHNRIFCGPPGRPGPGILVDPTNESVIINGNQIRDYSGHAIVCNGATKLVITNNIVKDNGGNPKIRVTNCSGANINGNIE